MTPHHIAARALAFMWLSGFAIGMIAGHFLAVWGLN
jgi:hypothetical protein